MKTPYVMLTAAALLAAPQANAGRPAALRVTVVHDAAPARVSLLDFESGVLVRSTEHELPAPAGEKARCQALSIRGAQRNLWVATDSRLMRLALKTGRVDRDLPLAADQVGAVVDLAAWFDGQDERVAVAVSPSPAVSVPHVQVLDGRRGQTVALYTAQTAGMSAIYSLHRDGENWALYNERPLPPHASGMSALTLLHWDGVGFAEFRTLATVRPGHIRGDAALARIASGATATVGDAGPIVHLLGIENGTTIEPFPELEWGERPVAAAADLAATYMGEQELPILIADASSGMVMTNLHYEDGTAELIGVEVSRLGAPPAPGTHLVVSRTADFAAMTSPDGGKLVTFDPTWLNIRGVFALGGRPTSMLIVE